MPVQAIRPGNRCDWITASSLTLALVLGGGGSPAPLAEAVLQVAAAAMALAWFLMWRRQPAPLSRPALAIAAILVGLPVLQLIPLPPFAWQALPGRSAAAQALDLVGRSGDWRSLSLDPARTLAALLAVLPPALMVVMTAALGQAGRVRLVAVLALGALATLVVGAAQVSQGADSPLRLYGSGSTFLEGFQANHNSTADVLLLGLVAAFALIRESALGQGGIPNRRSTVLVLALTVAVVAGLGVAFTASRMGTALLPVAGLAGIILMRPWLPHSRRTVLAGLAVLVVAGTIGGLILARSEAIGRVTDRYTLSGELRPELWKDSAFAARTYFPVGVGVGNFVPALLAGERLEVVRQTVPNRAHNDYLELLVEAGIPGLAALAAIAAILLRAAVSVRREAAPAARLTAAVGAFGLLILALHSLVDYPLRSMSIAMAAAACAGLILSSRVATAARSHSGRVEYES